MELTDGLRAVVGSFDDWARRWGPHERHESTRVDDAVLQAALDELVDRLGGNYPFFHARYAGQMLKPPHDVAVLGYVAAMLHNPNNHALDGGPPTSAMEKELVPQLAAMFHLPTDSLGHLTSSGTIANLEALFVARELAPGRAVAFSADAHYTHARMCRVLGVEALPLAVDGSGRLSVEAVEAACRSGRVGTIVATAGTTGLGMVDPIADIIPIARAHGVRVHVDAAYGGYFSILAWPGGGEAECDASNPAIADGWGGPTAHLRAIADADSVVVDPHKHGLQPYGCGAIVFRDPSVGRFYEHDSPYTYFTSDDLHLGEISLECSRSGAAVAALWLTQRVLPWTRTGLGAMLAAGLRAARAFELLLESSSALQRYQRGDLDIVSYLPRRASLQEIDNATLAVFAAAMTDPADPIFVATYAVTAEQMTERCPQVVADRADTRILRSVLMKPEHEHAVARLFARLESIASATSRSR